MSFDNAAAMSRSLNQATGKQYRIPAAHQWMAGLVVALELRNAQVGELALYDTLAKSYLGGSNEWVDTKWGLSGKMRYILGPSDRNKNQWIQQQDMSTFITAPLGVRFIRDP
jgi:hypothetical protein